MAFNGNGIFQRLYNWTNDANAGIKIKSDRMDNEDNGFAQGLSTCITRDGQTTITADLKMDTFKHLNVGDAATRTQYASAGQVQDGQFIILSDSTGTNTVTTNATPAITAYVKGQTFRFKLGGTNTGPVTLSINSLPDTTVQKNQFALGSGDWTTGDSAEVIYDGTVFQLLSPARTPFIPTSSLQPNTINTTQTTLASATTTDLGTISSQNVLITGTTTITAFGSSANVASPIYFVEFNDILTLTYNATSLLIPSSANITTAAGDTAIVEYISSSNWRIREYSKYDGTAVISPTFPLASTAETQAGSITTKGVTPGGLKGALGFSNLFVSSASSFTIGANIAFSHGLGTSPIFYTAEFVCSSTNSGYSAGDRINIGCLGGQDTTGPSNGAQVYANSSVIGIQIGAAQIVVLTKGSGATVVLTPALWTVVLKAWA
jgi:hypothetical protein